MSNGSSITYYHILTNDCSSSATGTYPGSLTNGIKDGSMMATYISFIYYRDKASWYRLQIVGKESA